MKATPTIGLEAGRARLGALANQARAGRPVVLTRDGEPVAAIVSLDDLRAIQRGKRSLKGRRGP